MTECDCRGVIQMEIRLKSGDPALEAANKTCKARMTESELKAFENMGKPGADENAAEAAIKKMVECVATEIMGGKNN